MLFITIAKLFIGGVFAVVKLFVTNIILFESVLFAAVGGFVSNKVFDIPTVWSVAIGAAVFLLLFLVQQTKVGFWILAPLMSLVWGAVFSILAFNGELIWKSYLVLGGGAVIMMLLHLFAKRKPTAKPDTSIVPSSATVFIDGEEYEVVTDEY
jgi:hypothetical protein